MTDRTQQVWQRIAAELLLFTVVLLLAGCDVVGIGTDSFIVRVDSITVSQAIGPGRSLHVAFYGVVGPDGCSRVSHIDRELTTERLAITFHGERDRRGTCTDMPVSLQHREVISPPLESPFLIRVGQPSGDPFERIVETARQDSIVVMNTGDIPLIAKWR